MINLYIKNTSHAILYAVFSKIELAIIRAGGKLTSVRGWDIILFEIQRYRVVD